MKNVIIVFILCFFSGWGQSQIFDVYQNKEYKTSMRVFDTEINKDYVPSDLTLDIDKNKDKNEDWTKIEDQLYSIAKKGVENEVSFFQLRSKAVKYQSQFEEWNRLHGESEMYMTDPKLDEIEIELLSVLNNCGIYTINYIFEVKSRGYSGDREVSVKQYYFADYQENKVISIGNTPTSHQQEILKGITLSKFKRLYLLQTQKLDLNDLEKLRSVSNEKGDGLDFAAKLYFSEAIVYPYFAGVMVEFPAFSNSSQIFMSLPFRIYINGEEVEKLLSAYPDLKRAFEKPIHAPSKEEINQLDNDSNFNLSRFIAPPKELDILDILKFDQKVYTMKINNYLIKDTTSQLLRSKKIFFDKNQHILLIEHRGSNDKIDYEEKYKYNDKNQLTSIRKTTSDQNLKLYHYENGILDYTENIDLKNRQDYDSEGMNMDISQQYFVYSNNYRYTMDLHLLGEFEHRQFKPLRYIGKNQFCTSGYCLLTNNQNEIIGVKIRKGELIDVLSNSKNQPLECYRDHDRYQYFFTYNDQDQIQSYASIIDKKDTNNVEYEYHPNESKALIIKDDKPSSSSSSHEYEYEFEFWDE